METWYEMLEAWLGGLSKLKSVLKLNSYILKVGGVGWEISYIYL